MQPREFNWGATWIKSSGSGLENRDSTAVGNRYADHVTPLYPHKLALTSPTGGGRSVGMVRSRTEATEFSFFSIIRSGNSSISRTCNNTEISHPLSQFHSQSCYVSSIVADYVVHSSLLASV